LVPAVQGRCGAGSEHLEPVLEHVAERLAEHGSFAAAKAFDHRRIRGDDSQIRVKGENEILRCAAPPWRRPVSPRLGRAWRPMTRATRTTAAT
jgi:hypothetical protein